MLNRRGQERVRAVLPVRVRGTDARGVAFEVLAHTLNFTPTGTRLGAIRCQLGPLETLTLVYRQRRMDFKVIWTRQLVGSNEFHIGLKAFAQKGEALAMDLFDGCGKTIAKASTLGAA